MTLRLRILFILAAGFATGLVLILLSYLTAARMHRTSEELVDLDLGRMQTRSLMREALDRVRRAQDRFVAGAGGTAFQAEVVRQLEQLDGLLDGAKRFMPTDGPGNYSAMRDLTSSLRDLSNMLAERYARDARDVELLGDRLRYTVPGLRTRLDELRHSQGPDDPPARTAVDRLANLGALFFAESELAREVDDLTAAVWRNTIESHQKQLRDTLVDLQVLLTEPKAQAAFVQIGEQLDQFARELLEYVNRQEDLEKAMQDLRARRDQILGELGAGADALVTDLPRDVDERRVQISNRRYNLLYLLGAAFLIGAAVVVAMAIFFIAGVERDVGDLKDAARSLERGELPVRLTSERATQELSDLGRAFDRLATTLSSVREKQTSYDRIVTGLNRSTHLHEILRGSLGELTKATRSKAGCVYLKVAGREELLLAETYAVPRGASTPELIRVGEGLIGEAARERKTVVVDDVPRHALKIVSATVEADIGSVILVPIQYKDELMGVLELAGLARYDVDTVHFAEDVVFQIAVAISNARALETIRMTASALERKTSELEVLNAELERANVLKSEFLATVSHELRTPLNAIIGFSELLIETDQNLTTLSRENLRKVLRNAEHLLALINDILDLSKIEAGKMDVVLEDLDVPAMVKEIVADFQPIADRKGIALHCDVAGAPPHALLDRDKTLRIVQNLVSNAVKFTEEGEVRVRLWQDAERLLLEVRDTGIGIDPDNLPVIFEKFRQADGSHSRRFGGTGLGLAITKELCHSMGGSVRVHSRPGKGSTFSVNLPLRLPDRAEPAPAQTVAG